MAQKEMNKISGKRDSKPERVAVVMKDNALECDAKGDDESRLFIEMFGIDDKKTFDLLLTQAFSSGSLGNADDKYNSIMPLLLDIAPQDALEGMLAVQMVASHNLAMEMTKRALVDGQTVDGVTQNVNRATKLMNVFKSQVETLQKYRNKGQQVIKVQHVTVNDGGQAIVGNVKGGKG
jgi:hypothetical protein